MSEGLLTAGCIAVELGLPLGLLGLARSNRARSRAAVVLGAVSPLLLLYVFVLGQGVFGRQAESRWALGAAWAMTFLPYVVCALLGFALSFASRPVHLAARFGLGVTVPAVLAMLAVLGG